MWRKPRNSYLYMPACSAHPESTKRGIAAAESHRIFRIVQCPKRRQEHIDFLASKLANRGYTRAGTLRVARGVLKKVSMSKPKATRDRVCVFKVLHSSGTPIARLRASIKKHEHVLSAVFQRTCRIAISRKLQQSNFLRLYALTWHFQGQVGGEGFKKPSEPHM